jgi:hypothetical protein
MSLENIYVNNRPYILDRKRNTLSPREEEVPVLTLSDIEKAPKAYHLAHLRVVAINKLLWYVDERLAEFRRVTEPGISLRFDDFVPVDEGGPHTLEEVAPENFMKRMSKEFKKSKRLEPVI